VALRIDSYQEPIDPMGLRFGGAGLSIDPLDVPIELALLATDSERPWIDLELLETDPDLLALDLPWPRCWLKQHSLKFSQPRDFLRPNGVGMRGPWWSSRQRASPISENRVQRRGHAIEVEGLYEESGVAFLVAGATAEEAGELRLERLASLRGLLLQRAERRELAFGVDDLLDAVAAESPNQLALDVGE
jgi:hypothetical protein